MKRESEVIRSNDPVESTRYGSSVIPPNRLEFLAKKCRETLLRRPGYVLEVGVYRAGSLTILAETIREVCPEYKVYGIDTFSGHPYTDDHPVHPVGKYSDVEIDRVHGTIADKGLSQWVSLFQGKVEEIFEILHFSSISFAHIDCDLYIPVKYCAENISAVMNDRGMIYFDDYGHEHCPGATKAIKETFAEPDIHQVYMEDDNTCWSCYIHV